MLPTRDGIERFGDRWAAWVRPKWPETLPIPIRRNRIYILPTGFGLFLALLLITMLIGGLNYNNNPALLLVFLLAAVVNNSFVHAHLMLSGISLKALHAEPVFAGQVMALKFRFASDSARERSGLELLCHQICCEFDLGATEEVETTLYLPTQKRGWLTTGRLRVSTLRPFGLARSWCWLRPATQLLVYPALDPDAPPLPDTHGDGDCSRIQAQGEQPHHLRNYHPGDMPRHIAWKASARADRLLVRQYEAAIARDITLDWQLVGALPNEAKIRRLARWVVEAERSGSRYRLHLPSQQLAYGKGAEHRHACLRALALMPHG